MDKKKMPKKRKSNNILVVGDWVVDEYWFLVRHQSDISSHVGFSHYRISSTEKDPIFDLCGAGHVARILYDLRERRHSAYNLFGLGNWNKNDTEFIKHLVHSRSHKKCGAAYSRFHIKFDFCANSPAIALSTLNPDGPTNRVVRQYHEENVGIEQINRVDWEQQRRSQHNVYDKKSLEKLDLPPKDECYAILVHDLTKGMVQKELIDFLNNRYPNARWFIRSKQINPLPAWINIIENSIELFVVGPEVAAILNPWGSWLYNGKITLKASNIIKDLPGKNVILLSDRREVVARTNFSEKCITGRSLVKASPLTQPGWPSSFYASLVYIMLTQKSNLHESRVSSAIHDADKLGGVSIPANIGDDKEPLRAPVCANYAWEKEIKKWEQAQEDLGIIKENGELRLDVWRGSPLLPGYVTCIGKKQEIITRIAKKLRIFKKRGLQSRSLSIMLRADPGSGKTFLAKSLADAFNFHFVRYDVTQMIHRDELIELFDNIMTLQTQEDKGILVFVDEINSSLEGNPVYSSFLAPLEEGSYVRGGKLFSLRPCVWIFAGTKPKQEGKKEEKLSDFESRLTMIESIDFDSLLAAYKGKKQKIRLNKEARLEQVYLGASMIRKHFDDVSYVSKDILKYFYDLNPAGGTSRRIRQLAASLLNVQYGTVTPKNCESWDDREWRGRKKRNEPLVHCQLNY